MKIDALRRYPIKGLPGQSLRAIRADAGGFAFDRVFGLEKNGGADDGATVIGGGGRIFGS